MPKVFVILKQKQNQLKKAVEEFNSKSQTVAKDIEETNKEVNKRLLF
jgi:hypothetical protein